MLRRVVEVPACTTCRALQGWSAKTFCSTLTFPNQMILAHTNNNLCILAWFFLNRLSATSLASGTLNFDLKLNPRRVKVIWLLQTHWNASFLKKINLKVGGDIKIRRLLLLLEDWTATGFVMCSQPGFFHVWFSLLENAELVHLFTFNFSSLLGHQLVFLHVIQPQFQSVYM